MALPFQVYSRTAVWRSGHEWCVRCQAWIPIGITFSLSSQGSLDPHTEDHLRVYGVFMAIDRRLQRDSSVTTAKVQ